MRLEGTASSEVLATYFTLVRGNTCVRHLVRHKLRLLWKSLTTVCTDVWEIISVHLAFMTDHGWAAVEALAAEFTRVQLNAMVTVSDVVSQLDAFKKLCSTLLTLKPAVFTNRIMFVNVCVQ